MDRHNELKSILEMCYKNQNLLSINKANMVTEILIASNIINNNQYVNSLFGEMRVYTIRKDGNSWREGDKILGKSLDDIIAYFYNSKTVDDFINKVDWGLFKY